MYLEDRTVSPLYFIAIFITLTNHIYSAAISSLDMTLKVRSSNAVIISPLPD